MKSIEEYEEMVANPGKFEGEGRYVPYFWDLYLNGVCGDGDVEGVVWFEIVDDDLELFPELEGCWQVGLLEDDQGFVREV